ncbi:MAG: hypothetical protein HQL32_06640 [Planctomycetes bacterium]|nr:hypothetical protein [Planctomycetota bacterium]
MIRSIKQWGARQLLNRKIRDFGTIEELKVDLRRRRIYLSVLLKGEENCLHITCDNVSLKAVPQGGGTMVIHSASSSREWVNSILNSFVLGKDFYLPQDIMQVLRIID